MNWLVVFLTLIGLAVCLPSGINIKPSNTCDPGYTGATCQNPICNLSQTIENHSGGDNGDMIFWDYSLKCTGEYLFYVDEYIQNVTVFARGSSSFFGQIFKGTQLVQSAGVSPEVPMGTLVAQFDFIADFYGYGQYRLDVTSDGTENCEIWITSKTPLMIDGGFIADRLDDNIQYVVPQPNQGVGRNPINNVSSYFAFQYPKALSHPATATEVRSYIIGAAATSRMAVRDRYKCAASLFAGPTVCDMSSESSYHVKVTGVDTQGNTWERVYAYMCESDQPPPTTTGAPPSECRNGGIMVNQGTPQQECYCGPYYEGAACEIKRCLNNGRIGKYDRCECTAGYSGEFCQHVYCEKKTEGYDDLNSRSITFVVRTGQSMVRHIQEALNAADKLYKYYQKGPNATYIQQWVLVTVTNGAITITNSQQYSVFQQALSSIPLTIDSECDDAILTGLSEAINNFAVQTYKRSLIFVFADGMPKDWDVGQTLLHQLSYFRGQIFFMLADSAGRCTIETASEGYRTMRYIAMFSHGQVVYISLDELAMATYVLAVSAHKADHIMTNDMMVSCQKAPQYQSFFVDANMRNVFITATGSNVSIALISPGRTPVTPTVFWPFKTGNLKVWNLPVLMKGGYLLSMNSPSHDPCSIRVFGFGDTSLWVGISHKITEDATVQQPVYKDLSHLVAKINNVAYPDPSEIHAEAVVWTNDIYSDSRTVLFATRGVYRDGCDFNLYFGSWRCTYLNTLFYVNIYVTAKNGNVIQRSYTGFCSETEATQTPPEGCLNGGYPITLDDGNRTCLCPAHYTGPQCEKIQCMNLGTPVGTSCECIKGFTGQYCETTSCYAMNRERDFSPNGRSLTLIIHDSIQTRTSIRSIKQQMPALIQDLTHQHKQWITSYEIWRFNDTSFTRVVNATDPNDFLKGITALNESNTLASDPSCAKLYVLPGLLQVLMSPFLTYEGIVYFYTAGYMNVDFQQLNQVEAIYELLETSRVMFNVVMMSSSPCGKQLDSPESSILMNFAAYTGGQYIMVMPKNAGATMRSVPTYYRNNYIYDNYIADCSSLQSIYFPVDSQMQSITVSIVGELDESSIAYYDPTGKKKAPYTIWADTGMFSRMDQLIKECDDGWDLQGNRCWMISLDQLSWTDARASCHGNDAVLVTILSEAEQKYIDSQANGVDYWIGLSDLENQGTFMWDTITDQKLSLDNTGYKNWGVNQPVVGDYTKRCVYDKRFAGWANDDCNVKRSFFCVKHAYDADYEPDFNNVGDLLQRGIWKATFKTTDGACNVQIYGQSGIQLYTQYAANIHSDFGTEQPLQNADDNRIIAHTTNQNPIGQGVAGQLQYSHFYRNNMTIVQAQTYALRDTSKCSYEYMSTGFKCVANNFLALTTGVDRFGYLYQRIQPVACFKGPVQGECINGVYNNGKCICDPNYEGDLCQTPICQKGTLNSPKTRCECFTGYTGPICDIPLCNRGGSQTTVPTAANRTLIFVLDGAQDERMANVAATWSDTIGAVMKEVAKYPGWFTHYTGVVFRDKTANVPLSDVIESDDPTDFTTKILGELGKPYTPGANKKARSTILGIARALGSQFIQPRSYVWVVTGGNPEDADNYTDALNAAARVHAYVNFLIVGDDSGPGDVWYNDTSLNAYYQLVTQTSGQFYQVGNDGQGKLKTFWTGLFPNYYKAFFITTQNVWDCSKGFVEYVQMSANATNIIVDALGAGQVNIFDPSGGTPTMATAATSRTNKVYVAAFDGAKPGLWKIQVPKSPGFCRVEVRAQSDIDVFIGYVHDGTDYGLHSNNVDYRPLADDVNSVVVTSDAGKINFVQMYSDNERNLIWSSPMILRRQCSYEYVSSNYFICTDSSVSVAVEGEDPLGYPFRRMIHTHCVGNIRTPPPPPANMSSVAPVTTPTFTTPAPLSCSADAKFDVVMAFDGSITDPVRNFEDLILAFLNANIPSQMSIDPDHMQFTFGSYSDSVLWTSQAVANDATSFNTWLGFTKTYGYDGLSGNNIADVFQNMKTDWMRPQTSPVLVLFSSIGWDKEQGPDDKPKYVDPRPLATVFRISGGKILPIGLGPSADEAMLKDLGGGCYKIARTQAEALSLVPWIISAMCSSQPYCTPA